MGNLEDESWVPPEQVTKPQDAITLDETHPGSAVVAEVAAAMAAGFIVFHDKGYYILPMATLPG